MSGHASKHVLPPASSERSAIYVFVEHDVTIGKKKVKRQKWVRYAGRDSHQEALKLARSALFTKAHATVAVCRETISRQAATIVSGADAA